MPSRLHPPYSIATHSYPLTLPRSLTHQRTSQRDYIHVTDLVEAHVMLLAALKGTDLMYYNVGDGSNPNPYPHPHPHPHPNPDPNPNPNPNPSPPCNQVGNGSPYTVLEIVKVVEKVTGKKVS